MHEIYIVHKDKYTIVDIMKQTEIEKDNIIRKISKISNVDYSVLKSKYIKLKF